MPNKQTNAQSEVAKNFIIRLGKALRKFRWNKCWAFRFTDIAKIINIFLLVLFGWGRAFHLISTQFLFAYFFLVFNRWKDVSYWTLSRRYKSFLYLCLVGANYLFNLFTMHKFNFSCIYICDLGKGSEWISSRSDKWENFSNFILAEQKGISAFDTKR